MSAATLSEQVRSRVLKAAFDVAEAGAMVLTGAVMMAVVIASQIVRLVQESAERRRLHSR